MMDQLLVGRYAMVALLGFGLAFMLAISKLRVALDPKEPPLLKPRVPIIGHVLGVLMGRIEYFGKLR
jgi:hypothetical protein